MITPGNPIVAQNPQNSFRDEIYRNQQQESLQNVFDTVDQHYETNLGGNNGDGKKNFSDYNGDWRSYLEDLVNKGDAEAADKLLNYLMSEDSANRQREWESHSYQRLVNDLKAAGINPYILLNSGASPISSGSANSYSGSQFTTRAANRETARHNQQTESLNVLKMLLVAIPMVIAMAL